MAVERTGKRPHRSLLARLREFSFTSALARRYRPEVRTKSTGSQLEDVRELTVEPALGRIEALEPDAACALYATLPAEVKEDVSERVSTDRWGALFVRDLAVTTWPILQEYLERWGKLIAAERSYVFRLETAADARADQAGSGGVA